MTELLQQAFERASQLPEVEQDKFARFLLAELESAVCPPGIRGAARAAGQ